MARALKNYFFRDVKTTCRAVDTLCANIIPYYPFTSAGAIIEKSLFKRTHKLRPERDRYIYKWSSTLRGTKSVDFALSSAFSPAINRLSLSRAFINERTNSPALGKGGTRKKKRKHHLSSSVPESHLSAICLKPARATRWSARELLFKSTAWHVQERGALGDYTMPVRKPVLFSISLCPINPLFLWYNIHTHYTQRPVLAWRQIHASPHLFFPRSDSEAVYSAWYIQGSWLSESASCAAPVIETKWLDPRSCALAHSFSASRARCNWTITAGLNFKMFCQSMHRHRRPLALRSIADQLFSSLSL